MIYTIPDYYKEFYCAADKCEDTCCAGWQIVIDKKSLKKYRGVRGKFMPRMRTSVCWLKGTFRQDSEKRCAFLNENNLCEMYRNLGEKSLCKTCRRYPRHVEEFEGVREISLSISCPVVARMLMEQKSPVTFLSYEKEGEEEYEDFDPFLFSILEDAREEMVKILQNRTLSIRTRALLVLGMAHDMQGRINRQELFECSGVIEKYRGDRAKAYVEDYLEKINIPMPEPLFDQLYGLELLRENWELLLHETEAILYAKGEKAYQKIEEGFRDWMKEHPEIEIHLEQLLVYFLFTYFPGAVYDGEVFAKAQMAVYCSFMIRELWMARWVKNEKTLEADEIIDLVYRFSREVEHSDVNLKRLEKMMEKKWFLRTRKIL